MKIMLLAAAGIAAVGLSAPAFADGNNQGVDTTQITINASTPAKCDLTSNANSVTLASYDISNDQGRARNNVGQRVAQALTGLNMHAWCTGASNTVKATRSSLNLVGSNGTQGSDGFNRAVIYDVILDVADAARLDGYATGSEGTEDASGPLFGRFGPTGQGSKVTFRNFFDTQSSAVTNGSASENPRSTYTENNARLVAGAYSGTLTIEITPGA